jgi:ABC-type multidrug transport system ATPase subunit
MHRNLTVHEVLYYQARLRLPGSTDNKTIKEKIRQVRLIVCRCLQLQTYSS